MIELRPVIYIDVLFFVNFFINYIILFTTAKISRIELKKLRVFLTSVVGALYAVFMFFPNLSIIYSLGAKLVSSLGIVALAFNIKGLRLYFKTLGIFYLVTLCFGGCGFALFCFTDFGSRVGAVISNGVVYMNLPWQILCVAVIAAYFIISRAWRAIQNKISREYINIKLAFGGLEVCTTAIVDTGNALCEPVSRAPVIVAEYQMIKNILPYDIRDIFENGLEENIEKISTVLYSSNLASRVRLIPFSSLGRENGMLVGFKPDSVSIFENEQEKKLSNVVIGVYGKSLSKDKSFHALLNPEIL